jgi:geranylgeranyl diphosphate synthase type II
VNLDCDDGVSSFDFKRYLSAHTQDMNKELDAALTSLPCPERFSDAMRHYVLAGGRRQCSMVAVACCKLVGGTASAVLPLACALEMILTASLIHDDMPCMDDAALRRGVPSCHVVFGEAVALQAGVALVALAFEHVARSGGNGIHADLKLRVVAELAHATGVGGIAAGQVEDMENEGTADRAISPSTMEYIVLHKTARLLEAAAALGAVVGGGRSDGAEVEHLRRYARTVGLLFQVVNDVLDVIGTTELLGQVTGKDAAAGKCTYVRLMGVEGARAYADELVSRAQLELEGFDVKRAAPLRYLPPYIAYQLHRE